MVLYVCVVGPEVCLVLSTENVAVPHAHIQAWKRVPHVFDSPNPWSIQGNDCLPTPVAGVID